MPNKMAARNVTETLKTSSPKKGTDAPLSANRATRVNSPASGPLCEMQVRETPSPALRLLSTALAGCALSGLVVIWISKQQTFPAPPQILSWRYLPSQVGLFVS